MNRQEDNAQSVFEQLQVTRQALERITDNLVFECERIQWRLAVGPLLAHPCLGIHGLNEHGPPEICRSPEFCLLPYFHLTPHQAIVLQSQQLLSASSALIVRAKMTVLASRSLRKQVEQGQEKRRASTQV